MVQNQTDHLENANIALDQTKNRQGAKMITPPVIDWKEDVLDFGELTNRLLEYESQYSISTIAMLRNYLNGEYSDEEEEVNSWFNTLLLYFATQEIKMWL